MSPQNINAIYLSNPFLSLDETPKVLNNDKNPCFKWVAINKIAII